MTIQIEYETDKEIGVDYEKSFMRSIRQHLTMRSVLMRRKSMLF